MLTAEEVKPLLEKQPWSLPFWVGTVMTRPDLPYDPIFRIRPWKDSGAYLMDDPLHIWEMPLPGQGYIVALDPSFSGEDSAGIAVVDYRGRQVAEARDEGKDLFPQVNAAVYLAQFYNEARLVIEENGPGGMAVHWAKERYSYLWRERTSSGPEGGFYTTSKNRERMIECFHESLKWGNHLLRSLRLRAELDHSKTGEGRCTDDLTMAYMIAHYCTPGPAQARGNW